MRQKLEREKAELARRMEEENNKLNAKLAEMLQLENEKHLREAEEIRRRMDREKEELQASMHQVYLQFGLQLQNARTFYD